MNTCHIVVGGGSSGLALCYELLKVHDVVLLELGESVPEDDKSSSNKSLFENGMVPDKQCWTFNAYKGNKRAEYQTTGQKFLGNRIVKYPQGRSLGGTSNVNAMIWTAGSPLVYDKYWPNRWSAKTMDRYLSELYHVLNPATLTSSGNMLRAMKSISDTDRATASSSKTDGIYWDTETVKSTFASTISSNLTSRLDLKSKLLEGWPTTTIHIDTLLNSLSESFEATHIVETFGKKSNIKKGRLVVIEGASVESVCFRNKEAVSVLVQSSKHNSGKSIPIFISNKGEIILCAGVFETPKILLNSTITEKSNDNSQLSIEAIGRNMQDHSIVPIMLFGNWYDGWTSYLNVENSNVKAYPLSGVHGWVNLDSDGKPINDTASIPRYPINSYSFACLRLALNTIFICSAHLLFLDGRVAASILPDMILPKYSSKSWYSLYFQPFMYSILQVTLK